MKRIIPCKLCGQPIAFFRIPESGRYVPVEASCLTAGEQKFGKRVDPYRPEDGHVRHACPGAPTAGDRRLPEGDQ